MQSTAIMTYIKLLIVFSTWLMVSTQVHANNEAWLTTVEGKVTYLSTSGKTRKALPFMGVAKDTKLELAAGATVGVMYSGGKRETWQGPATVVIGTQQSSASDPTGKSIQILSTSDGKQTSTTVVQVSSALDKFRSGKIGGMRMRGGPNGYFVPSRELSAEEQRVIDLATQHYQDAIKHRDENNLDAEWTYISVLAEYEQFELMTDIVINMKKLAPADPVINELHVWLTEG